MRKSKIDLVQLQADFDARPERVFSQSDLVSIFAICAQTWNLPRSMTPRKFIDMLLNHTKISEVTLPSKHYTSIVRYVWGDGISPISLALSIKRDAFCCHGSAMRIHGLGGDAENIFVNSEQSEKAPNRGSLTQEAIHRAFRNEQRRSKLIYTYLGSTITVLNGKNSGRLEVEPASLPSGEHVHVTSLERTLIDITVRPAYAGGIVQVLEAFRTARGRVSIEKMLRILKTLDYTYPFHQSIGFYMKRCGFPNADQYLVKKLGTPFDFYLGYGLQDPAFDTDFRVFFPKQLK